ncbi:MAG: hypothetical protein ACE5GE_10985 [Phycisphaerae bacterium]
MKTQSARPSARPLIVTALLFILLASGCDGITEAAADGLFSGVSDVVAGVVSDLLRAGLAG